MTDKWDFVIVGGGTAGCVLANRLSARSANRVILIEAGRDTPPGATPDDILDPYPFSYTNPDYRWALHGHPLTAGTSSPVPLLQARVMGGGSSIMGMVMLRGVPADYDGWSALGAKGWAWRDVLPYFRRLENDLDYGGELHGNAGPTEIRRHSPAGWPELACAAGAYADANGIPRIADMNAQFGDGYGILPIAGTAQRRASSAISYLTADVRARPNLRILARSSVDNLLWDGRRVHGVRAQTPDDVVEVYGREIILTMGALLTPYLMLRSGIGEPSELKCHNVPIRVVLPGVGANLQNHAALPTVARLQAGAVQQHPQRNHNNSMFRYSSGVSGCEPTDMALAVTTRISWHAVARRLAHFSPVLMAPASRGKVSLRDPSKDPLVEYNLLGNERDRLRMIDGLVRVVALTGSDEMSRVIGPVVAASRLGGAARFNSPTIWNDIRTRAIALAFDTIPRFGNRVVVGMGGASGTLRELLTDTGRLSEFLVRNIMPLAHHAGTCRMGSREDRAAVVDPQGRVYGVPGLRVADASIMPSVPRGNTNLPVLMLAEKLAQAMLESISQEGMSHAM